LWALSICGECAEEARKNERCRNKQALVAEHGFSSPETGRARSHPSLTENNCGNRNNFKKFSQYFFDTITERRFLRINEGVTSPVCSGLGAPETSERSGIWSLYWTASYTGSPSARWRLNPQTIHSRPRL
jgi:hypothetical protein